MLQKALLGLGATCVLLAPHIAGAANTSAPLPAPWSTQDVGSTGLAGSAAFTSGLFTVTGAGADIWGTTDAFQFVSRATSGDAQIVVRVASVQSANPYAKAGVMFRDTVAPGSAHVILDVRPNGSIEFMSRATAGAATAFLAGGTQPAPAWLRLTRSGSTFTGEVSPDGATWALVGSTSAALASNASIGLVVTSHDPAQLGTGTFDNVAITVPGVPAPWSSQDVGSTGLPGRAWFGDGLFTVIGAGADIWGVADAFQLVSRGADGDAQIVARVASLQSANTFSKAGVMFRDTVAAGSAHVLLDVRPNGSIEFMSRAATGAATAFLAGRTQPAPAWLRLTRSSGTFTGEVSADGATWTFVGSTTAALAAQASIGLVVTSHDPAQLGTATFDHVAITLPPSAPGVPTPDDAAIGIGLGAPLTWSAAGATSYDVNFGTSNPPARVATALTSAAYTPSATMNGVAYFWQVAAHNAAGTASGPVWSFTAIVAPPAAPGAPMPAADAISVPTSAPLIWSPAAGATSYDVRFGTANPPPAAAAGLTSALFTPPSLTTGTAYHWQIVARNAGGATAGPVWSFTTIAAAPTATSIIVLYAADASNLHGNWARVDDATAAGGQTLTSVDRGWAHTSAPLAAPADYFDFVFPAPAATSYHVWLRMRAAANSKYNDSVFAQFSDAVDASGAAIHGIGTTNGVTVNLANDSSGTGLSDWGWQDGAYWLTQVTTISFAATGSHTLRIQTREDGVSLDQVVLSATTYLTSAPGPLSSDTTIVAKPTPTPPPTPGSPATYSAISDRNTYVKPALPQLGPAGFAFTDPTFGSNMRRVTDGQTRPGIVNRSFRVPSNAHLTAWNASSTAFYVISNDGTVIPYSFDPATMTASRMQGTATANGGLTLAFYVEPQFSLVNPNVIYGAVSGANNRTISQYDFGTGAYSIVIDLDTIAGGLANTYVGGLMSGGTPAENLMTFFGGGSQDSHFYALWAPVGNVGGRKLLNTIASTINGVGTGTSLNFHLHSAQIDRSGRFVFLYPTSVDLGSPRFASQVYVWDTASDTVTAITSGGRDGATAMHPSGHDAAGYGTWVNQDCCTSSSWDAAQWQFRQLTSLFHMSDLISPILATKEIYLADHTTWNNAQPTALLPVISSTYRFGNNTAPWRAWDDEIIGIDTASGGGGLVWRFAHHRSTVASESNPTAPYFWYEPIANVSPNGRWVIFTSNWEKTLGTDSSEGTFRQDVFLVQLARP